MTKLNENGQLEWTFEELDLIGAIEELSVQIEKNLTTRETIQELWNKSLNSSIEFDHYCFIHTELGKEFKRLFEVRDNLIDLKNYEVRKNV